MCYVIFFNFFDKKTTYSILYELKVWTASTQTNRTNYRKVNAVMEL